MFSISYVNVVVLSLYLKKIPSFILKKGFLIEDKIMKKNNENVLDDVCSCIANVGQKIPVTFIGNCIMDRLVFDSVFYKSMKLCNILVYV